MPKNFPRNHTSLSMALLALGLSAPALHAQETLDTVHDHHSEHQNTWQIAQANTNEQQTLKPVTVEAAEIPQYLPHTPPSVSGPMPLTMRETPQSVSIITEERMRDEGLVSAADVLTRTTGVTFSYHNSQEGVHANARGFRIQNVLIDGLALQGSQTKMSADLALYERVEVMRGPAGLFTGSGAAGSPAGAINLVRKRPTKERRTTVQATAGSWNNYRTMIDSGGALNASGSLRGRGVISYVDRDFFYDHAFRKNLTLGGVMELDLTRATMLTFGLDYEKRKARVASPSHFRNWDGSDPGVRRKGSRGLPWGQSEYDEYGAFVELEHHFANHWNLKANYTRKQGEVFQDYGNITHYTDSKTGEYRKYISSTFGHSKDWDEGFTANLNGKFDLAGRTHNFVAGFSMESNRRRVLNIPSNQRGYHSSGGKSKLEIIDFPITDYSRYPWLPSHPDWSRIDFYEPDRQSGWYANFRFNVSDPLKIMAGARISRFSEGGISKYYIKTPEYKRGAYKESSTVTPFAALSYDLNKQHTLHAMYSEVFDIQDKYDLQGNRVDPLKGENWELGIKSDWNEGRLHTMLNIYRLDRTNDTYILEDNPCESLQELRGISAACHGADNKRRVTGIEFEINGRLSPAWDISVGATALKRKYVTHLAKGGVVSALQGQSWDTFDPKRQMNVWLLHRLQGAAQGWRAGLGMQVRNKTWTDYAASTTKDSKGNITAQRSAFTVRQGGYATFNAMLAWAITPQWNAQFNVNNLTNRNYQPGYLSAWFINNSEPRSYQLSVTGRF